CMGVRSDTVPAISRLNGIKIIVPGNHDDCHPMYKNKVSYAEKVALYEEHFQLIYYPRSPLKDEDGGLEFNLNHFPYIDKDPDYQGR
ncbi:hypothetical protein, partial [Sutterella massiliensis]|uniref:hypothetical protein n=1 Tax=Sutterella massiliensis TaxID=1816689 RepID=UPI0019615ECD